MALRNPQRGGAAASDLYLTPTATARGLVKQIMKEEEVQQKVKLKS